ncbi:MAG: HupE/UreJ family protein [Pseudomonadales bacterium]|nr:HupE/UreJ family protein [Pseudomonadales bacterium]
MRAILRSTFILLAAFIAQPTLGHDVDVTGVARVFLDEDTDNQYRLSIVDQQVPPLFNIERILPAHCTGLPPGNFSYQFQCEPALSIEDELMFPWALEGVVVVARWRDGSDVSSYFPGDGTRVSVPLSDLKAGAGSLSNFASRYLILGAEHILFGIDHLLFVLGLLLLLSGFWKLIKTITAFTIAHSITLAFAVLGIFPVPNAPIEALIALSILMLAREVVMGQQGVRTLVHEKPWLVAFIFGLFHGFGFAGALGELGLSDNDIPLALLFFNLGVEAGQIGFILMMAALHFVYSRAFQGLVISTHRGLAYGLGGIACFWFLERLPALFVVA